MGLRVTDAALRSGGDTGTTLPDPLPLMGLPRYSPGLGLDTGALPLPGTVLQLALHPP